MTTLNLLKGKNDSLTEHALSAKSLRLMRMHCSVAAAGLVGFVALATVHVDRSDNTPFTLVVLGAIGVLIVLGGGSVFNLIFSPLTTRFAGSEDGLDEWERSRKAASQAFAYRAILGTLFVMYLAETVFGYLPNLTETLTLPRSSASMIFAGLLGSFWLLPLAHLAWTTQPMNAEGTEDDAEVASVKRLERIMGAIVGAALLTLVVAALVVFAA